MIFKKNVETGKALRVSNWRKTAVGTWSMTGDCQVYCIQTVNIEPALEFLQERSNMSLTHLAGKACGLMIKENPQINRLLKFGKFYQREHVSIFFQVAMDKQGKDLSGHTVRGIDQLSLEEIRQDMERVTAKIKKGDDVHYKKVKKQMTFMPSFLLGAVIKIYGFILYGLNLWSPLLGAPRDAFGSMMITNIGSLGMQTGLVPLIAYSRCPLILALGSVYERVVPVDGEVKIQKCVDCCWTLDHRMIDGVVGANMAKGFQKFMENPSLLDL